MNSNKSLNYYKTLIAFYALTLGFLLLFLFKNLFYILLGEFDPFTDGFNWKWSDSSYYMFVIFFLSTFIIMIIMMTAAGSCRAPSTPQTCQGSTDDLVGKLTSLE